LLPQKFFIFFKLKTDEILAICHFQSASLLLRIDLILSGMSKKPKGGDAQPQAQQAPAGDEVSPWIFIYFFLAYRRPSSDISVFFFVLLLWLLQDAEE
jgi:hypothetical protein